MLFDTIILLLIGFGFLACAGAAVVYDIYLAFKLNRVLQRTNHSSNATRTEEILAPQALEMHPDGTRWNAAAELVEGKGTSGS